MHGDRRKKGPKVAAAGGHWPLLHPASVAGFDSPDLMAAKTGAGVLCFVPPRSNDIPLASGTLGCGIARPERMTVWCAPRAVRAAQVEEDPTGGRFAGQSGALNSAPHKLEDIINFHVGDIVTALQRAAMQPAGQEVIVYATIMGAIGAWPDVDRLKRRTPSTATQAGPGYARWKEAMHCRDGMLGAMFACSTGPVRRHGCHDLHVL
jgi:CPSF A subunit region